MIDCVPHISPTLGDSNASLAIRHICGGNHCDLFGFRFLLHHPLNNFWLGTHFWHFLFFNHGHPIVIFLNLLQVLSVSCDCQCDRHTNHYYYAHAYYSPLSSSNSGFSKMLPTTCKSSTMLET